ncbi:MAG TPA: hypothetical protein VE570_07230 [Thermoleophilaceae bacterium]|nr:hypothetical protein [Thermoleophilaceae bacterium]
MRHLGAGLSQNERPDDGPPQSLPSRLAAVALLVALAGCGGGGGNSSGQPVHVSTEALVRPSASAGTLQRQFIEVVKAVAPTVVQIQTPSGLGSGVVLDDQGRIVTNAHVVGDY